MTNQSRMKVLEDADCLTSVYYLPTDSGVGIKYIHSNLSYSEFYLQL